MHPLLGHLGSFEIHFYSVFFPIAILMGIILSARRARLEGFDELRIYQMFIVVLISVFFGMRLLHIAANFREYWEHPRRLLNLRAGAVLYGGYLGAIAGGWLYLRAIRHPALPVLDITSTYYGLGLAIHRSLACFMAGCCFGKPTDLPWGVVFPEGSFAYQAYGAVPVHPTQIYEALLGLIIFIALVAWRRRRQVYGELWALQLYIYSIGRFVIEFARGDSDRGFLGPLSTSQWISVVMFLIAVGLTMFLARRRRLLREGRLDPRGVSRPHDYTPLAAK